MAITLQFSTTSAVSSGLIRAFERGWPSHVDALAPEGLDWWPSGHLLGARSDAIGGQLPGVRIRPPAYEAWTRVERLVIPATDPQAAQWAEFLRAQLGKPYDTAAILGFVIDRPRHLAGAWICSALQTGAQEASGVMRGPMPLPPSEITPWDLYMQWFPWAQRLLPPFASAGS